MSVLDVARKWNGSISVKVRCPMKMKLGTVGKEKSVFRSWFDPKFYICNVVFVYSLSNNTSSCPVGWVKWAEGCLEMNHWWQWYLWLIPTKQQNVSWNWAAPMVQHDCRREPSAEEAGRSVSATRANNSRQLKNGTGEGVSLTWISRAILLILEKDDADVEKPECCLPAQALEVGCSTPGVCH